MLKATEIADNWRKVVEIYSVNREKGHRPDLDAEEIVKMLGFKETMQTFACIIRLKASDGRIYGRVRDVFSRSVLIDESAAVYSSDNPVIRAGLDDIHPAHIQQLGTYILKYAEENNLTY